MGASAAWPGPVRSRSRAWKVPPQRRVEAESRARVFFALEEAETHNRRIAGHGAAMGAWGRPLAGWLRLAALQGDPSVEQGQRRAGVELPVEKAARRSQVFIPGGLPPHPAF